VAITVVLSDDHPLMLKALDTLLREERDFKVLAQCADAEKALYAVRTYRPDILVQDVRMPGKDGLAVVRQIKEEKLSTRVVLLATALDDEEVLEATRLGVGGIVLKEMAPRLLVQCLRKVHAGEPWLERRAAARAFEMLLRREAGAQEIAKMFTQREIEVLRLAARGLRNKAISEQISVSEGTVKTHLHHIYEKLQVQSRAELIVYCKNKGIL